MSGHSEEETENNNFIGRAASTGFYRDASPGLELRGYLENR